MPDPRVARDTAEWCDYMPQADLWGVIVVIGSSLNLAHLMNPS
jgi:hypothetical protein